MSRSLQKPAQTLRLFDFGLEDNFVSNIKRSKRKEILLASVNSLTKCDTEQREEPGQSPAMMIVGDGYCGQQTSGRAKRLVADAAL
ncbi:MAG: hypothetical protein M3362_12815 [Acidobacteriota bacterium]|nr:hypothetical protein [Acidobacteriota bacterium]